VDGGRLDELPLDDAVRRWKNGDGAFWVDAGSLELSSLEPVLDRLDVSEFLKTRCSRVGRSTIVLTASNATFATLPLYADAGGTQRIYGAAVCLPRLLLTFRGGPVEGAERRQKRLDELELEDATTSSLLMALLVRRAAATAAVARGLRDELTELGERMDENPDAVEPMELETLKRRVSLSDAIAEEQEEAFALIAHAKSLGFDTASVEARLGLLTTMASSTVRLVERNDARIDNLLRRVQDHKTELLNRRLGVLTIVSAIFMPLTLLAGIWGMNFEHMPELSYPNAYAWALSLMAFLALGATWIFYRGGWFD
jgi:magnesium transporter